MELICIFKYLICSWKFSASPLYLLACGAQQSLSSSASSALFLWKEWCKGLLLPVFFHWLNAWKNFFKK